MVSFDSCFVYSSQSSAQEVVNHVEGSRRWTVRLIIDVWRSLQKQLSNCSINIVNLSQGISSPRKEADACAEANPARSTFIVT